VKKKKTPARRRGWQYGRLGRRKKINNENGKRGEKIEGGKKLSGGLSIQASKIKQGGKIDVSKA